MNVRPIRLLLVDDSPADRSLVELALRSVKLLNDLKTAEDGEEALELLQGGTRPDLILLDLNMPGMNGHEFLQVVKTDPELKTIPVVILTSSVQEDDVARSYENHCAGYIRKPVDLDGLVAVLQGIQDYWVAIVRLPGS